MRGDEKRVEQLFIAWLVREGWTPHPVRALDEADVVATRGDEELRAEVKGATSEPGLDADTGYGQLLRRMVPAPNVRYAMVGPPGCIAKFLRVPLHVRDALAITVYEVHDDGSVTAVGAEVAADLPTSTAGIAAWLGEPTLVSVAGARRWHGEAAVLQAMERVRHVAIGPRARAFFDELNAMRDRRKATDDWPPIKQKAWLARRT